MKIFKLKRIAENKDGTFGVLIDGDVPFSLTCEDRWRDNKKNISCIPYGSYICKRVKSSRFGNTFEITDVPNRTHILFHTGNTELNTHGCILIGERFEYYIDRVAVLSSKVGFQEFLKRTRDIDKFELIISEAM